MWWEVILPRTAIPHGLGRTFTIRTYHDSHIERTRNGRSPEFRQTQICVVEEIVVLAENQRESIGKLSHLRKGQPICEIQPKIDLWESMDRQSAVARGPEFERCGNM